MIDTKVINLNFKNSKNNDFLSELHNSIPTYPFLMLIDFEKYQDKESIMSYLLGNNLLNFKDRYQIIKNFSKEELNSIGDIMHDLIEQQQQNEMKEKILIILDETMDELYRPSHSVVMAFSMARTLNFSFIVNSWRGKGFGTLLKNCATHYITVKT
jgi:hypothetical protein